MAGVNLTMFSSPLFGTGQTGFNQQLIGGFGEIAQADFPNSTSITLQCRINNGISGVTQVMMGMNNQFFLAMNTLGQLFYTYNGIGNITTSAVINDSLYHQITLCVNATDGYAFVDGVLVDHQTTGWTYNPSATAMAVREFGGVIGSFPWSGAVDEAAIFTTAIATSTFTPPTGPYVGNEANLVQLWHLDGDGSTGITSTGTALFGSSLSTGKASPAFTGVTHIAARSLSLTEARPALSPKALVSAKLTTKGSGRSSLSASASLTALSGKLASALKGRAAISLGAALQAHGSVMAKASGGLGRIISLAGRSFARLTGRGASSSVTPTLARISVSDIAPSVVVATPSSTTVIVTTAINTPRD